ncbi:MAG: RidA family protein [bacterium]|nr:RidA family protein [bacterium]
MKKTVFTAKAPAPVGPYSQGVRTGNMLFISGTLPIDPQTGELEEGDIEKQTKRVLENIRIILESENLSMESVVKVNVFLTDMSLFSRVNRVYGDFFKVNPPARSAVGVKSLPKNSEIEMEAIASYED